MRVLLFILSVFLTSQLLANVDLTTSVLPLGYGNSCEQAGAITLTLTGNDFVEASLMYPIYIRLRHPAGVSNCQTLVNYGVPGVDHHPIYLAMALESPSPELTIAADPTAVSIIRWVEGERDIWIKVQQSTSEWLTDGTNFYPPSGSFFNVYTGTVSFTIGLSGRVSHESNEPKYLSGKANRPANQRETADDSLDLDFVSTLSCVDLTDAFFEDLTFDATAFVESTGLETDPVFNLGYQYPVNFSGNDKTGTMEWQDAVIQGDPLNHQIIGFLCAGEGDPNGLISLTNRQTILIDSDYAWHNGSALILESPISEAYGFPVGQSSLDPFGNPVREIQGQQFFNPFQGGRAFSYPDDIFTTIGGGELTHRVYLVWEDQGQPYAHFPLEIEMTVATDELALPGPIQLEGKAIIYNHDSEILADGSLYDGVTIHCNRQTIVSENTSLLFGYWDECLGTQASYWPLNITLFELVELVNNSQLRIQP